jgi:HSP20 family molecular chaperone IbpA
MNTQNTADRSPARAEKVTPVPTLVPPVDVFETQDELLIHADFPGVPPDGVDVRFEKNQLTLVGHAQEPLPGGKNQPFDWQRTFVLPGGVDPDKISAELRDGTLTVRLPKRESLKPRQIHVRSA